MNCNSPITTKFILSSSTRICRSIALVFLLLWQLDCYAQETTTDHVISFKAIDLEAGLAAREAYTGVQDGRGFIWFGTRNGLNRYDGKVFQLFTKQTYTMQGNNIVKVASDLQNQIFILYGMPGYSRWEAGMVDVFNQNTLTFTTLSKAYPNLPFKENSVYWITNNATDTITFLTKNPYQVWSYTPKSGFWLRFEMKEWNQEQRFIHTDPTGPFAQFYKSYGYLGFGGHSTTYILDGSKAKEISTVGYDYIKTLAVRNNGSLLVRYKKNNAKGIAEINKNAFITNQMRAASYLKDLAAAGTLVIPIVSDTNSIVQITGKGLFFYSNNNLIKVADHSTIKDFSNLSIYECFADKLGNTWLCTSSGVFKIRVKNNKFSHLFTKQQQSLQTNNQVRGILEDQAGTIYANIWDDFFMYKNGITSYIKDFHNYYALIEHNNNIYTTSYDIKKYEKNNQTLTAVVGANSGRHTLSAISMNDSIMLLGKMEGIYRYNTNTGVLSLVKNVKNAKVSVSMSYRFFKRTDGTFWVASETGLLLLNKDGDIVECFGENDGAKNVLPVSNFTDVIEDAQGVVWATTNGFGLYKWDRKKNRIKHFGVEDGLSTNALFTILEDNEHNFWIGSESGLILINAADETAHVFWEKDGLSNNEFNRMSAYKAADGKLFFGGMNGINCFYPKEIINDTTTAAIPLEVISFYKFSNTNNALQDLTAELLQTRKIVLDPGDKFFSLEFRLLDFENKITRYVYKIEGQDKDWNYTTESSIRISGLPSGNYTLRIKAQTVTGHWSTKELKFAVEVNAAFYNKPWFLFLMFIAFLLLGVLILNYRTQKLKKDKVQLEAIINNRTTQLKTTLSERELLLKEIHHRVKNNLQIISGLLDLQKEEIEEDKSKAVFNEGQSRVKSIALIHQNLYQNEDLANVKFSSFVQEMAVQVGEVFEHLDSKTLIKINMPDLVLDIDTAVPLALIINELLTNSFKYASVKNKTSTINIEMVEERKGNYRLIFADNGPGIDPSINFDIAVTLGLRLIRGLAAQLYGEANYHFENGSVFTITFKDTATRKMED